MIVAHSVEMLLTTYVCMFL